jgi:Uma2 family endonuclease
MEVPSVVSGQSSMVPTLDRPKLLSLNLLKELLFQIMPAQFAELAKVNGNLRLESSAAGALIVSPHTGDESGNRTAKVITQLGIWSKALENLGEAFDCSTGFELPNGANRC